MTTLTAAIEAAYAAFAHERPVHLAEHSPLIHVRPEYLTALRGPLRTLGGAALEYYQYKAMTTWGDAATFRYFLPRLLERAVDLWLLADKLAYARWRTWPSAQTAAVEAVLHACAATRLEGGGDWQDPLDALWRLGLPVQPHFERLLAGDEPVARLVDLVDTYLRGTPYPYRGDGWAGQMQRWLLDDRVRQALWASVVGSLPPHLAKARDEAVDLLELLRPS